MAGGCRRCRTRPIPSSRCPEHSEKIASSPETVGEFRLGQISKLMIQGNLYRYISAKAIRLFGSQFRFTVEALHDARGNRASGVEPVENPGAMFLQHVAAGIRRLGPQTSYWEPGNESRLTRRALQRDLNPNTNWAVSNLKTMATVGTNMRGISGRRIPA